MNLWVQFSIVSILPLSFLGMAIYTWRYRAQRRRLSSWWVGTLIIAAIWASSLMSVYLGIEERLIVGYNWRFIGRYAQTLMATFVLVTTIVYVNPADRLHSRWLLIPGLLLWAGSLALDPQLVPYDLPSFSIATLTLEQFDLWGIVWVASWLTPMVIAWLCVERANYRLPRSLYRNQVRFWFLTVSLLIAGGTPALSQGYIGVQQAGAIVFILGSFIGTVSITQLYLPALQTILRQFFVHVARAGLLFLLSWGTLVLLTRSINNTAVDQESILVLAAALFALIFLGLSTLLDAISQRVRYIAKNEPARDLTADLRSNANLLTPVELSNLFLQQLEADIPYADAWIMSTNDVPGGHLFVQPMSRRAAAPAIFKADNPFVNYMRQNIEPLTQQDIDSLSLFETMDETERHTINEWQRTLYIPLHVNQGLIGLIGLQGRSDTRPYTAQNFAQLQNLAQQFAPLFVQSQNLQAIQQINQFVFRQNRELAQETRRLGELVQLYQQFMDLLNPQLRQPFMAWEKQLMQMPDEPSLNGTVTQLQASVAEARAIIDNLILVAARLEQQTQVNFATLRVDAVLRTVINNLRTMAEARHIRVEMDVRGKLLAVWGDEARLGEALQQVVHNAIKYSRLNEVVQIVCEMVSNEIRIQVIDNGVGIAHERLNDIWRGLSQLSEAEPGVRRRTRLGLSLSKFNIQLHGGRIDIRSTYGVGSTVTIYLPALLEGEDG